LLDIRQPLNGKAIEVFERLCNGEKHVLVSPIRIRQIAFLKQVNLKWKHINNAFRKAMVCRLSCRVWPSTILLGDYVMSVTVPTICNVKCAAEIIFATILRIHIGVLDNWTWTLFSQWIYFPMKTSISRVTRFVCVFLKLLLMQYSIGIKRIPHERVKPDGQSTLCINFMHLYSKQNVDDWKCCVFKGATHTMYTWICGYTFSKHSAKEQKL